MNIAAVINVAPGQAALSQATQTQTLLLEHLGHRLGSIRLAVPRLLKFACLGAIAEKPDLLVIAGGSRAARRAAQVAYAHRLPIVFLPGTRSPHWARRLWHSLSLEAMVAALAEEAVAPLRLPAGIAGGHIFFGNAICGFLPQIQQLRDDLSEAQSPTEAARVLAGAVAACGRTFGPKIGVRCHAELRKASTVVIDAQASVDASPDATLARYPSFACTAWNQGAWAIARASLRIAAGGNWQNGQEPERFGCTELTLHAGARPWLLLDGEPVPFRGPIEIRYLPETVETFAFVSDRARFSSPLGTPVRTAANKPWNVTAPATLESRVK